VINLGTIYGNVGITGFSFAVSNPNVKKDEYIQLHHEHNGVVLGRIVDLKRTSDLSLDKIHFVSRMEKYKEPSASDEALQDNNKEPQGIDGIVTDKETEKHTDNAPIPKTDEGKLLATVSIVGYRDERGLLQMPQTPFKPGSLVYMAEEPLIKNVLGLRGMPETGAYIGLLKGHEIKIYLDINSLVQKHVSVLAKTGAGKSYAVGVIIEELMKKKVPLVIIDPHGEYSSMRGPNDDKRDIELMSRFDVKPIGFSNQIVEYSPDINVNKNARQLKFSWTNLEPNEIIDLIGTGGGGAQAGVIFQTIKELKTMTHKYTLRNIIDYLKEDKSGGKWNTINALEMLTSIGLFGEPSTRIEDLVRSGQTTIINFRGVPPSIQEIAVKKLANEFFELRKREKIPPLMLMMEEVHNFAPQQGTALCSRILRTIASEGRKFGLGMCVVSQRPAKVDKNIISQCNTQIILKVTNPNDLKAIVNSVEGLTAGLEDEIQRLPIGVGVVCGGSIATPVFVEFRIRHSRHGGKSIDVLSSEKSSEISTGTADTTSLDKPIESMHIYTKENIHVVEPIKTLAPITTTHETKESQTLKPIMQTENVAKSIVINIEKGVINIPSQTTVHTVPLKPLTEEVDAIIINDKKKRKKN
jgi:DNA helicase HerA-like ATPase